ncbi:MAG TPA: hypothetical protein PLZ84_02890 [Clostridia bacterium]|nr:hypothetical protein [Clostridia bacterium]
MKAFFSLLRLQLKVAFGWSAIKYNLKNDKRASFKSVLIGFAVFVALAQFIGFFSFLMLKMFEVAKIINAPELILTMSALGAGLIVFFFGIFYILSVLFFAKDSEILSALPIKPIHIFTSKFIIVLLGEYPFVFAILLPAVIIYGTGTGQGLIYYLLAVLGILMIPILPLVISALLAMLLMTVIAKMKHRDFFVVVASVIMIVLIVGGQNLLISRIPEENTAEFLLNLLQSNRALIEFFGRMFPPSIWLTKILSGIDVLINIGLFVGASVLGLAVVLTLASFIYQRGSLAQLETAKKTKKGKIEYSSASALSALYKVEWKMIVRTPIYALNSLVGVVMGPLMMAMPLFGGTFSSDPDFNALFQLINTAQARFIVVLVTAGIVTFFGQINAGMSTTFSREGKNIWILKTIPVDPRTQAMAKMLVGYTISAMIVFTTGAVMAYAFKLNASVILMCGLLSLTALVPISAFSVLIDMLRPKLTWNNQTEAIKQNLNAILGMLAGTAIIAILGGLGYLVYYAHINIYLGFAAILAVAAVLGFVAVRMLMHYAPKAYEKISP